MLENPRRGRQARNFTTNVPKILVLKSSSEQIFSRKLPLGAPVWHFFKRSISGCKAGLMWNNPRQIHDRRFDRIEPVNSSSEPGMYQWHVMGLWVCRRNPLKRSYQSWLKLSSFMAVYSHGNVCWKNFTKEDMWHISWVATFEGWGFCD